MASEDLRALIAAGPTVSEESVEDYLGVPTGYVAPRQGQPQPVAPRYRAEDIYTPGGMSPEEQARLQQTLDRHGLFQKGDTYVLGRWDETTQTAYKRLLNFANQQGYTQDEALTRMGALSPEEYDQMYGKGAWAKSSTGRIGGVTGPGTGGAERQGSITQGMSNEDLRYLADRTARTSLGRKLTADELSRFSGAYQSMLNQANQRAAGAQAQADAGADVTYAGPTDPEAFASAQLEKLDPVAFGARKQLDAFKVISQALAGPFGQGGG
jgi:hypothetical protein